MRKSLIASFSIWLLGMAAVCAQPFLEKTNLFQARTQGYELYRIPGIVVTAKGTVLAYCEARRTGSDWADMDVLMRRSTDGGRTWDEPRNICEVEGPKPKNPVRTNANPSEVTYNNPIAIADRNGTVHLLFCLEYMRCFYQRSTDDGLTWSKPVEITSTFEAFRPRYNWKVLATGPGHGIQLRSGRLLAPVWISPGGGRNNHSPNVNAVIYSDDGGATWQAGSLAVADKKFSAGANETALVELPDGKVLMTVRAGAKDSRQVFAISKDGGKTWARPFTSPQIYSPGCMAGFVRHSSKPESDRNRILFSLPAPQDGPDGKILPGNSTERKNLTVRLSYDDGKTWPVHRTLEPGMAAYSDLAVLPDGTILCFYEANNPSAKKPSAYGFLTVARFNLEWLTGGKDKGARR